MASHIEHEINSCLSELEKLQLKMRELQKQKEIDAEEEKEKVEDIEPNLTFMEEWLTKSKENDKLVNKVYGILDNPSQNTGCIIAEQVKRTKTLKFSQWIHKDKYPYILSDTSVPFAQWQDQFDEDDITCLRKCFNVYKPNNHRPVKKHEDVCRFADRGHPPKTALSLPQGYTQSGSQQEFMMNFVEATYNMFQIQQKRIEELEMLYHS